MAHEETDVSVLAIHEKVLERFSREQELIPGLESQAKILEGELGGELTASQRQHLENAKRQIETRLSDLKKRSDYNFYMLEAFPLIQRYKTLLNEPVKVNFLGRQKRSGAFDERSSIVRKYVDIASQYVDVDYSSVVKTEMVCGTCSAPLNLRVVDEGNYVCVSCYSTQPIIRHTSSYSDIKRVNVSSKYMYDRKVHFRDCINQYQGKQNCVIPNEVYEKLEEQFELHHLLEGDSETPKEIRFRNITKYHILLFLKELNFDKQYENVHLIHHMFTGVKPDDIGYLEEKLLDDFDSLTQLYYDKHRKKKQKSFINIQYVLYQLLRKYRHPCKKEDFVIPKTIDLTIVYDNTCKALFEELGWNHTPLY